MIDGDHRYALTPAEWFGVERAAKQRGTETGRNLADKIWRTDLTPRVPDQPRVGIRLTPREYDFVHDLVVRSRRAGGLAATPREVGR